MKDRSKERSGNFHLMFGRSHCSDLQKVINVKGNKRFIEIARLLDDEEISQQKDDMESNLNAERIMLSPQRPRFTPTKHDLGFVNRKESEEETEICRIVMLQRSYVKRILLVPLLCLLTAGFVLLFCYWSVSLKMALFYSK